VENNQGKFDAIIAHELGHAIWSLYHNDGPINIDPDIGVLVEDDENFMKAKIILALKI